MSNIRIHVITIIWPCEFYVLSILNGIGNYPWNLVGVSWAKHWDHYNAPRTLMIHFFGRRWEFFKPKPKFEEQLKRYFKENPSE